MPELLVREMESVLRLDSGQIAVLGGLMQDNHQVDTNRVPVLSDVRGIGAAFGFRRNHFVKTELVIFIRPRVIRTPGVGADLRDFRSWLPASIETVQPTEQPGESPPDEVRP